MSSIMMISTRKTGFSLIEMLVTLLVISVGLLGIAGMEVFNSQSNHEAIQRTNAVMLAKEMMEKMRANPQSLANYANVTVGNSSLALPASNCKSGPCSAAQLASYQLWDWERALDGASETAGAANTGGLVQPHGCITGPAGGTAGVYTVSIAWRGNTAMNNPTISNCGQGSGLYGANDEFRRVITVDLYISDDSFT